MKKSKVKIENIYPKKELAKNVSRYGNLLKEFKERFGEADVRLFSAPGRTELGGNHTDHNKGKVLAAAIQLDTVAVVAPRSDNRVFIYSKECGDKRVVVELDDLRRNENEKGKLSSLVRGIAKYFIEHGFEARGFNALFASDIPFGAGLSSSAAVETLLGEIFGSLFNSGKVSKKEIALAGKFAENEYFGKPCGLMDQLASAYGGIVKIDFATEAKIEKIDFNFDESGYALLIVKTGGNHSDLTEDYSAVIKEMQDVSFFFGKNYLGEIEYEHFCNKIPDLRKTISDRAILRALHFFEENKRVEKQAFALERKRFEEYLKFVAQSGNSSAKYLQNLYSEKNRNEQGIALALALTEKFLTGKKGAVRVHGGGFAGTVQAYLSSENAAEYKSFMERFFGKNSVLELSIRKTGVTEVAFP